MTLNPSELSVGHNQVAVSSHHLERTRREPASQGQVSQEHDDTESLDQHGDWPTNSHATLRFAPLGGSSSQQIERVAERETTTVSNITRDDEDLVANTTSQLSGAGPSCAYTAASQISVDVPGTNSQTHLHSAAVLTRAPRPQLPPLSSQHAEIGQTSAGKGRAILPRGTAVDNTSKHMFIIALNW